MNEIKLPSRTSIVNATNKSVVVSQPIKSKISALQQKSPKASDFSALLKQEVSLPLKKIQAQDDIEMSNATLMQHTVGPNEASPLQIEHVRDFKPKGSNKQPSTEQHTRH